MPYRNKGSLAYIDGGASGGAIVISDITTIAVNEKRILLR